MRPPSNRTLAVVRRAITSASPATPAAQALAALEAAEPHIALTVGDAVRDERMSFAITVANRERLARYDFQQQVVLVCVKIARKHHRAKRPAASAAALECVEAVRALLPEVEE